jgi:DNA-binding beta-propeller fold protein YncE
MFTAARRVALVLVSMLGCSSASETPAVTDGAPTAPTDGTLCSDQSLGVCRIADAGVRQIPLARAGANGLAVDPSTGRVYIAINGATTPWCGDAGAITPGLSIVDPSANREVAVVTTGESPVWPLVDVTRGKVYVAGSGGRGTVAVHNRTTGALERSIVLGGRPHDLGIDPAGSRMVVSNTFDLTQRFVSVVDVATDAIVSTISVPDLPHKVVVDSAARVAYVVSLGAGQVTAIDLVSGAKLRDFSSGLIPQTSAMAYSPARRRLYVAKTAGTTPTSGTTIVSIDPATGTIEASMGTFTPSSPSPTRAWGGFGLDDANGLLYAAVANSSLVSVVDLATLKPLAVFGVADCPWAVALDVARGTGYVASNRTAMLTAFDLAKVKRAIGR